MSQVPPQSTLRDEDFPTERSWIGSLFFILNPFLTATVAAINGGLVFNENLTGHEQALDFVWSGDSNLPLTFTPKMRGKTRDLKICQALQNGSPIIFLAAWDLGETGVQITKVAQVVAGELSSLTVGSRYQIRVRVTP